MSNLLDKASIILTPTAYDDGKVLAAKPSEAPYGDFDFTRNSSATRVNAQGLVEDVQILSSNLILNGDFSEEGVQEVSNGSFSQESSELITNGDFATDSDWQLTQATISNGKATFVTTDGSFAGIRQNVFTIGKTYLISLEVSNLIGTAQVNTNGGTSIGLDITSNGIKSFYMVAENTDIEIKRKFGITNVSASIDNVSVKEVGQDWTLGSGWSIGEDKAIHTGAQSLIGKVNLLTIGKSYKITFDLSGADGSNYARLIPSQYPNGGNYTSDGTITVYTATLISHLYIYAVGDISITNISVKEVGQNWSLGSGVSIGDNKTIFTSTPSGQSVGQNAVAAALPNGALAKVSFEVLSRTEGSFGIYFSGTLVGTLASVGVFTGYFTKGTETSFYIRALGTTSGSISNVNVIQITDDTNLPRINYSGFTYQDSLGSELVVNGDFSSQDISMITGAGIRSIVNGELKIEESTLSYSQVIYSNILDTNKIYKATFDITFGTGSYIIYNTTNGNISLTSQGSGTYTFYLQNTNKFYVGSNGVGDVWYMDNISVKEYSGQEVVPDSGCGAWLFEPESTNRVQQSELFSDAYWLKNNTIFSNSAISPNGLIEADKMVCNANSNNYIFNSTSFSTSANYTNSVYLKKDTSSGWMALRIWTGGGQEGVSVWFDLDNGVLGTSTATSGFTLINATSESLTNDWYRLTVSGTTNTFSYFRLDFVDGDGLNTFTNVIGKSCFLWGAQAEQANSVGYNGEYATSYIPTEGTIKTRNQDLCTNGGDVSLINSSEGVLYLEASGLANGVNKGISISSGNLNNSVNIFYLANNNTIRALIFSGSSSQASIDVALDITSNHKIAIKYSLNDVALWIDGLEVGTDTNALTPIGMNTLNFSQPNGADPFFGNTKALGVWKEALTDAELRSLTYPTPTAATFDLDFNTIATDFTFTRNSEATFVNAQGLIQSTNELGAEVILNGDFSNGSSSWTEGTGWNISGGKATTDGTINQGILQVNVITIGKTYKYSFTVSDKGVGVIDGRFRTNSGFIVNFSAEGTYEGYFTAVGDDPQMLTLSLNTASFSIDNISVKEVITETNTPRLDYSTGAEAFLLEPQRTNLFTYSESTNNFSALGRLNCSYSLGNGYDGFNSSCKITNSTFTNSRVQAVIVFNSVNGESNFFTLRVKKKQGWYLNATGANGCNSSSVKINLSSNGGYISSSGTSETNYVVKEFSNYYLIGFLTTQNTTTSAGLFNLSFYNNVNFNSYDLTTIEEFNITGIQWENNQSYATSYIPTSGTTVTRNQELCYDATPVINSEEGVLYAEIAALANDGTNRYIFISDGTNDNGVRLYYTTINNRITARYYVNGTATSILNFNLSNGLDFNKIAFRYKENDFSLWANGSKVATDTLGATNLPNTLTNLSFATGVGSSPFFGNTKGLKYYPKALADVELQDLTTI